MNTWTHPYQPDEKYQTRVAYFSMEFAIDQALKIYSGGLGYLAGSHMRSAFDLKQNMIGIGMLWKYGYYDQVRDEKGAMKILFRNKYYTFLKDSGIMVSVFVKGYQVRVKALYLDPEIFGNVPLYLLTTDIPENDHLSTTITRRLYDPNDAARIAQSIVLGIGGAKVVEELGGADIYHLNEAHALPVAFYLQKKFGNWEDVKKHLVFTTHTPEKAGNSEHDIHLLNEMGFFNGTTLEQVREHLQVNGNVFGHTPAALRLAKISNGVSQLHGEVANDMWKDVKDRSSIIAITNSQNKKYWADKELDRACRENDNEALKERKRELKKELFLEVANQTGKLFDPDVLTIVWARRFAGYKRAGLIMRHIDKFLELINREEKPLQFIWAGKPYPEDQNGVSTFNHIRHFTYKKNNVAVLTGYELKLSALLKKGSDIWLNTPRRPQEASGTSGMTAAMNGSINFSTNDGWIPEFARHAENSFDIPVADLSKSFVEQDDSDYNHMIRILEEEIVPTYYDDHDRWLEIMKNSMRDVAPMFDSDRMADEYYRLLYDA